MFCTNSLVSDELNTCVLPNIIRIIFTSDVARIVTRALTLLCISIYYLSLSIIRLVINYVFFLFYLGMLIKL